MFFPDRPRALAGDGPGRRSPEGRSPSLVPAALDAQPAFAPFVDMAARHAGPEAMSLLSTYFACGNLDELTGLVESAGLQIADRPHPPRHLPSPVGRRVRDHRSREHTAGRADLRRRLPAHPRRRPRVLAPFTTPDGQRRSPLRVQHRGGPPAMSDIASAIHPALRARHGLNEQARQILDRRLYAVLGTENDDRTVHLAPVMFLLDGARILIETVDRVPQGTQPRSPTTGLGGRSHRRRRLGLRIRASHHHARCRSPPAQRTHPRQVPHRPRPTSLRRSPRRTRRHHHRCDADPLAQLGHERAAFEHRRPGCAISTRSTTGSEPTLEANQRNRHPHPIRILGR